MITLAWYAKNPQVLHHKAAGKWDWDTYYSRLDEAWALIAQEDRKVDLIIDFLESDEFPPGILLNAHRGFKNRPRNVGMVIVVDKTRRTAYYFNMLLRINRALVPGYVDVRFVDSLKAAEQLINPQPKVGNADE